MERRYREMSRNPLLLSLMIKYFQDNGDTLPRSRFELYQNGIDYMLTKYEQVRRRDRGECARPVEVSDAFKDEARTVLRRVAAALHLMLRGRDIRSNVHSELSRPGTRRAAERRAVAARGARA